MSVVPLFQIHGLYVYRVLVRCEGIIPMSLVGFFHKGVTQRSGGWHYVRPFAGVNTLFIGDFWQIPPVGQVAIMGNPHSPAALESARAQAGSLKNNGKENTPLIGPHIFNLDFDAI